MDMMETIELEDLKAQARQVLEVAYGGGPSESRDRFWWWAVHPAR